MLIGVGFIFAKGENTTLQATKILTLLKPFEMKNRAIKTSLQTIIFRSALLVTLLFSTSLAKSQELKTMANFTLNIIKYIGWSDEQLTGNFVIGVVGKSDLSKTLRELTVNRKFGFQDIEVKDFAKANKIAPCQVLFVGKDAFFDLLSTNIINNCGQRGFLLITEEPNALAKGAVINFYHQDDKLKFEISEENAQKLDIKYADKLKAMADTKE